METALIAPCLLLLWQGTESSGVNWEAVGAIATAAAVIIALFHPALSEWRTHLRRPKLSLLVSLELPHADKLRMADPLSNQTRGYCYFLRLWIENNGKTEARHVEVFVSSLFRQEGNRFERVAGFYPANLLWSHYPGTRIIERILPEMGRHCDLARIDSPIGLPKETLNLAMDVQPTSMTHALQAGRYRLELKIASENSELITKTLEIEYSGKWYDTPEMMFSQGVKLKPL
jgi:hypothetical protein